MADRRRPDFDRLEMVLRMEGEPDLVPFYEHLVDEEVIDAVLGVASESRGGLERARRRVRFYRTLGYDYVPMEIKWPLSRTNVLRGPDVAALPKAERVWVDQKHGTIETWHDFESYAWPEDQTDYAEPLLRLLPLLPEGMRIIAHACGGVLENTMWLMGARPFIRCLYSDRRVVQAVFSRVGSALVEAFSQAAEVDGVGAMCLGDDMGLRTGTMIPPRELRRYVFPWQRKICRVAHSKDLPFILHACGNLTEIMDELMDYVGIDAKHSFEDAIMPIAEVKRRWGDRVALLGGVDVDVLTRKSPSEVARYVRTVLEDCLPGGGWALGSGNSIPNYVRVENYLAMLREGEKVGRYPS